jgi:hypothetical protein
MRDELDQALDENPDYPPGFYPLWLEDGDELLEPADADVDNISGFAPSGRFFLD